MKKFLPLAVLALAISLIVPATSVDARGNYRDKWSDRVCNAVDQTVNRRMNRLNEHRQWTLNWAQRSIDFQNRIGCVDDENIVTTLSEAGQFNTLLAAATAAGLGDVLSDPNAEFTLFAPTDKAFAKLGQDTINSLLGDIPALTDILLYHVVAGEVTSDVAITLPGADMVNGDSTTLEVRNGSLFINDSKVVITDLQASNGVIHVIDTVLIPPSS